MWWHDHRTMEWVRSQMHLLRAVWHDNSSNSIAFVRPNRPYWCIVCASIAHGPPLQFYSIWWLQHTHTQTHHTFAYYCYYYFSHYVVVVLITRLSGLIDRAIIFLFCLARLPPPLPDRFCFVLSMPVFSALLPLAHVPFYARGCQSLMAVVWVKVFSVA